MTVKCNVIIVESQKGFSEKVREYLQTKGVSSHNTAGTKELSTALKSLANPVLLLELPDDAAACKRFLDELSQVKNINYYPLILLGKGIKDQEKELGEIYKVALCFNKPTNNSEIYDAIIYIADTFEFPTPESLAAQSAANRIEPPQRLKSETQIEDFDGELPASELYSSFSSIPNMFFDQLNKFDLLSKDFQGKRYVTFNHLDDGDKPVYITEDPATLEVFKTIIDILPVPAVSKIYRVAFLSHQIVSHITKDDNLTDNAKMAAILFNWVLAQENKSYIRKDYVTLKGKTFRKELCSKIKDSAMKCALDLKKSEVADLISRMGKYVGREEAVTDDPIAMVSSALAAADMIDRACWANNHFMARAAYKIMVMAKSGKLSDYHPIVLCCLIKLLSESLASNIKIFMIPRKHKKDPALIEAARRTKEEILNVGERKVELNELTPGMRLSRPLMAFDGREILEQDMVLDQDLIWRIWQLSMVRVLNSPLVVDKSRSGDTPG